MTSSLFSLGVTDPVASEVPVRVVAPVSWSYGLVAVPEYAAIAIAAKLFVPVAENV